MHSYKKEDAVTLELLKSLNPCFNGRCTRTNFEKAAIARFGMS